MSSPAASEAAATSAPATQPSTQKVTFRFCHECANLLYPLEDKMANRLMFYCRACSYTEPAKESCVYRNDLSGNVGETAGITQNVGDDPTVGDDLSMSQTLQDPLPVCTMCGQELTCEGCGEAEAQGLFLEVDDPASVLEKPETEHIVSDPESDEEMVDGQSTVGDHEHK